MTTDQNSNESPSLNVEEKQSASEALAIKNNEPETCLSIVQPDGVAPVDSHVQVDDGQRIEDAVEQHNDQVSTSQPKKITGSRLYVLVGGLCSAVFLILLDSTIVATAIPQITNYFDSIEDLGWYGSAYLLANCTVQPLAGRIYTHQSLKWCYIVFILLFEIGNLICGAAVSSKMLIVGRAIAGMGGAGISNGSLSIVAHVAPIEKRPMLVGIILNISRTGAILGPVLGGILAEKVSWRWVFYINCPFGAISALIIFFIRLPEREDKDNLRHDWKTFLSALDLRGFVLFAPGCIMFLLALQWGGVQYAWNSPTIIGLLCGSVAMIAIFVAWEARIGDRALIPLSMLHIRTVWSGFFLQILQFGCLYLLSYYLPVWFQAVQGASPLASGLMTLPSILSQLFVGLAAAWAVQRVGYFMPFSIAGCISTAIGAGLMTTFEPSTGPNLWIGYQILMGSGRALAGQISLLAIQYAVPKSLVSLANSVLSFSSGLGAAIFVAAGQTLFTNLLYPALEQYAPEVDPQTIINAGATNVPTTSSALHGGVVLAYNYALTRMFFLGCAASAASLFFCFGLGWGNIKKKREQDAEAKPEKTKGQTGPAAKAIQEK